MDWKDTTPKQLHPAIKHIQHVFDGSDFKCKWITQHLCFADLHPGTVKEQELTEYRSAFADLRKIVGPSMSRQFDMIVSAGTPSATFHGYAEMYRSALNTAVRDMLSDALQIAISNAALIGSDPVEWAKSQVENRIRNGRHRFATWTKNVCDVQPLMAQTPVTDEDLDEMVWWRKWRAPRFIHMRPSANTPFDALTAWTREDEHKTSQVLDGLSKRFTEFVEIELGQLAGRAYVQMAKRGLAGAPQGGSSLQDISGVDAVGDHKFARMAIEQARKSLVEDDGRSHPLVGAVVVKDGEVLSVAHRGEIAPGNHAEFVALEKKLANVSLTGATVYTTLEPCTTRNHPKVPCAERLIDRKVARVVIGMLDPDERIRGFGQMKLRTASIATQFFPADLMSEVEELNREFSRDRIRKQKASE
jgi:pyrimidine deaminase RibD-like protein